MCWNNVPCAFNGVENPQHESFKILLLLKSHWTIECILRKDSTDVGFTNSTPMSTLSLTLIPSFVSQQISGILRMASNRSNVPPLCFYYHFSLYLYLIHESIFFYYAFVKFCLEIAVKGRSSPHLNLSIHDGKCGLENLKNHPHDLNNIILSMV